MITVYAYVLDTMADWELGFAASELNSGRFFKKDAQAVSFKTVGTTREPIKTMGGLTIIPDLSIEEIVDIGGLNAGDAAVLLLPGANSWNELKHAAILEIARKFLQHGAIVCAICGATAALANAGLLNDRRHASNGPGFLEMAAPGYAGQRFYVDEPAVTDGNLVTAGATGALPWARHIIELLDVFRADTLEEWHEYFSTGEAKHFFALMQTLQ